MIEVINKYFPEISHDKLNKLETFRNLLIDWNDKINLISRKDIENVDVHHILHSLSIAKFIHFQPQTRIMDLGSGGGLPGIPLAIIFPESSFMLIDRIGKKIKAVAEMADALQLGNVAAVQADVAEIKQDFDFVVSRGVMPLSDIYKAVRKKISPQSFNSLPNGLISLKGGDLTAELAALNHNSEVVLLSNYFDEPFFETKEIVFTPVRN